VSFTTSPGNTYGGYRCKKSGFKRGNRPGFCGSRQHQKQGSGKDYCEETQYYTQECGWFMFFYFHRFYIPVFSPGNLVQSLIIPL
jgi:hypothetical protein